MEYFERENMNPFIEKFSLIYKRYIGDISLYEREQKQIFERAQYKA